MKHGFDGIATKPRFFAKTEIGWLVANKAVQSCDETAKSPVCCRDKLASFLSKTKLNFKQHNDNSVHLAILGDIAAVFVHIALTEQLCVCQNEVTTCELTTKRRQVFRFVKTLPQFRDQKSSIWRQN